MGPPVGCGEGLTGITKGVATFLSGILEVMNSNNLFKTVEGKECYGLTAPSNATQTYETVVGGHNTALRKPNATLENTMPSFEDDTTV